MKTYIALVLLILTYNTNAQNISVVDSVSIIPVPFATISFGNGLGTFADEEGNFAFSTKKYSDVDTLYISAIGYAEKAIATHPVPEKIFLKSEVSQLSEIIVSAPKKGKFKIQKQKPATHTDIFACWLPTVESEVAIFFERYDNKATQISKLLLPINAEAQYKTKGKGKYATIFRLQFYDNANGLPGDAIPYEDIVFAIDEKQDKVFELDITSSSIFIPETGIYASLQVLGYANASGGLAHSKKYREIKTARGIQKISTSFRPLLPFSKGLPHQKTYVRRVFLNNKKWQVFDKSYNKNSKLVQTDNRYYNMGAVLKVWEN